jgi:NAD(P)-dependent dehydrogenase (short-subunit alcohol dehydrogenase family)
MTTEAVLQRRVWLVTGAGSGLGRSVVDAVLAQGDHVVAGIRDPSKADEVRRQTGGEATIVALDVDDDEQPRAAVQAAVDRYGRVDVLMNNAGYGLFGALEQLTDEDVRHQFETNVFGAVRMVRAVLPQMRAQRSGHLVQISSLEGVAPIAAGEAAYAASKFALAGLSEGLAKELAPLGIRVTVIEPGPVRTEFGDRAVIRSPNHEDYRASVGAALEWFANLAGKQPNDPANVAAAILDAVNSDRPPLHLALGKESVELTHDMLDHRRAELEEWSQVSAVTAFAE